MTFVPFGSWVQLLDAVSAGYKVYYQGPLDHTPKLVSVTVRKDGRVRVTPVFSDADAFTADETHLSRFRREGAETHNCTPLAQQNGRKSRARCGRWVTRNEESDTPTCEECARDLVEEKRQSVDPNDVF